MPTLTLPKLDPLSPTQFPVPESALSSPQGLLAYGGDLSVERLYSAYHQGIFPWFSSDDPILWWCPDPRAVLLVEQFHLSRSMKRFTQHSNFRITINVAFEQVIAYCASTHQQGTWITPEVIDAWTRLANLGLAQSIEVWQHNKLIGGLYGMALGGIFCGESMFSLQPNASKMALMQLCRHFALFGGEMIDCQILNPHTASLGADEISRHTYLEQLHILKNKPIPSDCWQKQCIF